MSRRFFQNRDHIHYSGRGFIRNSRSWQKSYENLEGEVAGTFSMGLRRRNLKKRPGNKRGDLEYEVGKQDHLSALLQVLLLKTQMVSERGGNNRHKPEQTKHSCRKKKKEHLTVKGKLKIGRNLLHC